MERLVTLVRDLNPFFGLRDKTMEDPMKLFGASKKGLLSGRSFKSNLSENSWKVVCDNVI